LLHALIECLSEGCEEETATDRRHRSILARFEDWLIAEPSLSMTDLCAALGVSDRLLRVCCKEHLGKGPSSYRRLRGMQQVHRALRSGNLDGASVSEVARRHGFHALGRFATNYRAPLWRTAVSYFAARLASGYGRALGGLAVYKIVVTRLTLAQQKGNGTRALNRLPRGRDAFERCANFQRP
jgi:AraC-like DNA-binding protein